MHTDIDLHIEMKPNILILVVLAMMAGTPAWAQGDVAKGKKLFQRCRTCHALKPGTSKYGPSLRGLFGRKAGTAEGYNRYSPAMKESGVAWNAETLDKFLAAPKKFIPGNRMPYPGLKEAADRADLIAYLKQATQ